MSKKSQQAARFPIEKVHEALKETGKVRTRILPLVIENLKVNIQWVFQILNYLHVYLTKPNVEIIYKFNSLYAIKAIFDTSNFILTNWIQIFFLPHIKKVAIENFAKPHDYFISQGYTQNDIPKELKDANKQQKQQITGFGYNFITLALQMMQIAGQVKPYRLFQNEKTQEPSNYFKSFQEIKIKGYHAPKRDQLKIYKLDKIQAQIKLFNENLQKLSTEQLAAYDQFSVNKLVQYLKIDHDKKNSLQYEINIMQIYESGDLFVIPSAINICKDILSDPKDLTSLKNSIRVFHHLMLTTDYQTFYVLNYQDALNFLFKRIIQIAKSHRTPLQKGSNFMPQFKNPVKSKQVYIYFLDCFHKWTNYVSVWLKSMNKNQSENILRAVEVSLTKKFGIQFPIPSNLDTEEKIFFKNLQDNKVRHQKISNDFQQRESDLKEVIKSIENAVLQVSIAASLNNNLEKQNSIKKQNALIHETPQDDKAGHSFIQKMNHAKHILSKFNSDKLNYKQNRQTLQSFSQNVEKDLQKLPIDVFDSVLQQATQLNENIIVAIKKSQAEMKNSAAKIEKTQSKTVLQQKVQTKANITEINQISKLQTQKRLAQLNKIQFTPVKNVNFDQSSILEQQKASRIKQVEFRRQTQQHISNKNINKMDNNIGYGVDLPETYKKSEQKIGYNESMSKNQVNHSTNIGYQVKNAQKLGQSQVKPKSTKSIKKTQNSNLDYSQKNFNENQSPIKHISKNQIQNPYDIESSKKQKQIDLYQLNSVQKPNVDIVKSNRSAKIIKQQKVFEQCVQLEEDLQQNLYINKPKQFKSLGRYKLQSQKVIPVPVNQFSDKLYSQDKQQNFNQQKNNSDQIHLHQWVDMMKSSKHTQLNHNNNIVMKSDQQNSRIIQSRLSEEQQYADLLHDQINAPNLDPMQESFHDIGELEEKIKHSIYNSKDSVAPSFKKCFEHDKYVLPQDKKTKIYWLQNDTTNLIKTASNQRKSRVKQSVVNIPQILQERNQKFQHQIKLIQQQKNSKIKELQSKIKNLQCETVSMKDQIQSQKQEIITLKVSSEYDKESQGQRGYLKDMQNFAVQRIVSPTKLNFGNQRNFDKSNFKESMYLEPTGKLINSKIYKNYFDQFTKEKQKKGLLKNKQLLYKDDNVQIGAMGKKQNQRLIITFYITPQINIMQMNWVIKGNQNLSIESQPLNSIPYIRAKKQEKIYLTVQIHHIPYLLPTIQFSYISQQTNKTKNLKINIPCAFHKFIFMREVVNVGNDFDQQYFSSSKKDMIIRGEQVPYSKRILKSLDNIKQYLPSISSLNKGQPNEMGQICYGGIANFSNQTQFAVKISIKPNQFLYINANMGGIFNRSNQLDLDYKVSTVEYYITLLTHLFMKDLSDSSI